MSSIVQRMTCLRYDKDRAGLPVRRPAEVVDLPSWQQVQTAVRRMENYCFPIVELMSDVAKRDGLIIVGGPRRYAAASIDGSWSYERMEPGNREVRLWASDQGYYCRERNVIRTRRKVLEIAKVFYDTGDFRKVSEVAGRPEEHTRRTSGRPRHRDDTAGTLLDPPGEGDACCRQCDITPKRPSERR